MSDHDTRTRTSPQLLIGGFITLLGLALTLDRLFPDLRLQPFWPLLVLAIGVVMFFRRTDRRGRFWGVTWMVIGGWMLLHELRIVSVGVGEMLIPLLFLLIGGNILSRAWRRPDDGSWRDRRESGFAFTQSAGTTDTAHSSPGGRVSLFALMAESRRASNDNPFRGGEMSAIMGGCRLDLRQAAIPPGETATIDVFALMAGHEIWVPPSWGVASDVTPMLGGVDDKRLPSLEPPPSPQPVLRLRGLALMGSVVIKN